MNQDGGKVILPRRDPPEFWNLIEEHYVRDDAQLWRGLAALVLREQAGWTYERIGLALGCDQGHVCRVLNDVRSRLKRTFRKSNSDWPSDNPDKESTNE